MPHRRGLAQLRLRRDLKIDAQRFQHLAHRVDDQLMLVTVLRRRGQGGAAGLVGIGVGQARRRTGERPARHHDRRAAPPAARGWRRPARHRDIPPPAAVRSTRYAFAVRHLRRQAVHEWCARPAVRRRPAAAPWPAPPCAGRCRIPQPVHRRARCGRGARRGRASSRAIRTVGSSRSGQSGSVSMNCTVCGRISAVGLGQVKRQGAQDDRRTVRRKCGPRVGEPGERGVHAFGDHHAGAARRARRMVRASRRQARVA